MMAYACCLGGGCRGFRVQGLPQAKSMGPYVKSKPKAGPRVLLKWECLPSICEALSSTSVQEEK
jgi:hypothetical protein